jgi:MFS transporter, DHA1 family, multidrug resistance protein
MTPAPAEPSRFTFILMLGVMSAFGPLAMNMLTPAIPTIARNLETSTASIQVTFATYMIGFSFGQLFWGSLSERIGRRRALLCGFSIFLVASLICALAGSNELLLAARLFQGFGGCTGIVLARAIISDRFVGAAAAVTMSWQQLIVGIAPVFAPLIGGVLLVTAGWRSIFAALMVLTAALLVALWRRMPETRSEETAFTARTEGWHRGYRLVLANRRIFAHLVAGALSASALMTWYAGAGPLFEEAFHWSTSLSAGLFAFGGAILVVATQVNRALLAKFTPLAIVRAAIGTGAIVPLLCLLAIAVAPVATEVVATVGLIVAMTMYGFISANNQAFAFSLNRTRAGSISALIGASGYALGAFASWLVALLPALRGVSMLTMMSVEFTVAALALVLLGREPPAS